MSTADLAIVALAVTNLAAIGDRHYLAARMTDRVRVVAPPKQPAAPKDKPAAEQPDGEQPLSILGGLSSGEAA